ncbi:translation initiation factor IF-2-like [Ursus maritimus]|uniref:Translation initiation factor IF-2-like n=1 Tax=Ursus maritimus TaxID=29073 RepID=A0A8M1EX75_URSMA|nr:translation initiation factor IF-2-like [Ursus maritimus]
MAPATGSAAPPRLPVTSPPLSATDGPPCLLSRRTARAPEEVVYRRTWEPEFHLAEAPYGAGVVGQARPRQLGSLMGPPAGPPLPGRPYLAVQPREAAAGREARGRGRPGHGTGSARWRRRFVSGAARLAQPRERATRTEGGGDSRTVQDPRARPFNPSQPTRAGPAPSFIPPSDWPPRLDTPPGFAKPPLVRLQKPLKGAAPDYPNPQCPIPGKRPRAGPETERTSRGKNPRQSGLEKPSGIVGGTNRCSPRPGVGVPPWLALPDLPNLAPH